jgi:hypothetical protein
LFAALPLLAWSAALVPLLALALLLRARRKLSFVLLAASCVMAGWSDAALRAQALIVPHHGSKTPSTPEFLRAVDPKIVVYPVGYPIASGIRMRTCRNASCRMAALCREPIAMAQSRSG